MHGTLLLKLFHPRKNTRPLKEMGGTLTHRSEFAIQIKTMASTDLMAATCAQ